MTTFVIRPSSTVSTCPPASERLSQSDCSLRYKALGCAVRKGPKGSIVMEAPEAEAERVKGLFEVDVHCHAFIQVGYAYDPAYVQRGASATIQSAATYLMKG